MAGHGHTPIAGGAVQAGAAHGEAGHVCPVEPGVVPITVEDLQQRILAAVAPLPVVEVPLEEADGLILAEDAVSTVALPPFDNSAMDGYAVRLAELAGAEESSPVSMPVSGEIGAGATSWAPLAPGTVAKVMTGAPVPEGCDAVVPYEWTDRGAETVRISQVPSPGQHIRPAGDDVTPGQVLLTAGTVLGPRQLGLLAAVGQAVVRAHRRPRVSVLSTGSELIDPGQELAPGQIYDANSHLVAAAARTAGAQVRRVGATSDDPDQFLAALRHELTVADLIVTSGGVSQGDFDVVKAALRGGSMWFGPVAMQPGKPQGFGVVDSVPIFTLPGNPVSAYLSFEIFVRPALRTMLGQSPAIRPSVTARLSEPVRSPAGRRQFLRAAYQAGERGELGTVTPVGGHGSHLLGSLARADALVVIGEDVTEVAQGAVVEVLLLDPAY